MNLKKLCLQIAQTEDANQVIKILKKNNLWDNDKCWNMIGHHQLVNECTLSNAGIINNQQSKSVNALVEKLINSGDSALQLKCRENGINPKGNDAPKNVNEAIETLLDVDYGRWINVGPPRRRKLGEKFCNLVVTGESGKDSNPTYTIIDQCEGQSPENWDKTFLSHHQNNKDEIPFVQGKFGMGGYGVLPFCTVQGIQLIISKRNPVIQDKHTTNWGFTITRRFEADANNKKSRWAYLVIDGEIPSFESDSLKLLPTKFPNAYGDKLNFGTFIKLYNYDIGPGLRAAATFDLSNRLASLLNNPVVPVRIHERRNKVKANSYETTVDGLETRLDRNEFGVINTEFSRTMNIDGETIEARVFCFNKYNKKGSLVKPKDYANGVIYTLNGQSNARVTPRFFSQKRMKYGNISDHLLVLLDCSKLSNQAIEGLFKANREDIFETNFSKTIKEELAEWLRKSTALKTFQNDWRKSEITKKREDDKKVSEIINKLINKDMNLAKLLAPGLKLSDPFDDRGKEPEIYTSSEYPTFFRLKDNKSFPKNNPRNQEKGRRPRISLETDAPNDYIVRPKSPADFKIFKGKEDITHTHKVSLGGHNGKWNLWLGEQNDDLQEYTLIIDDDDRIEPFEIKFFLKLIQKKVRKSGERKPNTSTKSLKMPEPIHIKKEDFAQHGIDKFDALWIEEDATETYYYLNMDNFHLRNYLNRTKESEIEYIKYSYEIAMCLIALIIENEYKKIKDSEEDITTYSKSYTRYISTVILHLMHDLNEIAA